ncbi:MAG TPA: gluconate:H+ symporter [Bacteroidales bacterium]|jgi:Gnt-I system high-affinity gluconate transporter|nr:gluconate:H+ symporter [Bacteroidales bacterium]
MPILIVALGIILLILLITVFKLDTFISFVLVSFLVGISEGMNPSDLMKSIEDGIGSTLGSLVMILGFGAMLGKLVAESGAAQRIASSLISLFGIRYVQWAMVLTGFIVGISMFYSVGFVILIPIIFTVAAATNLPLLYVGIPLISALSVTHGFLPPHPSPTAISIMFHANMGKTLLYGIIIGIPTIIIAGPFFGRTLRKIPAQPLKEFVNPRILSDEEMPGMGISVLTAILPVILIILSTIIDLTSLKDTLFGKIMLFIGNPAAALLISVLFASYSLGLARGKKMKEISETTSRSVMSITTVLLIIAGAGILKEVLTDSGVSDYIGNLMSKSQLSPLFLGWLIAAVLRISVGSATVSALTAGGIVMPVVAAGNVNAELMVISIGAGSLMLSQVNDVGFWMYKEYFTLSVKDTLRSWTVMETIVGVSGLIGVLILNSII